MTPARIGLLWREHRAILGADRAPDDTTQAPQPAREDEGSVADLAYWASLPLSG